MSKKALALHLVEKGLHKANLQKVPETLNEWDTGNWWISDRTAAQLQGQKVYLHKGQDKASHIGGEVIFFRQASGADTKRKVFRFRESPQCFGVPAPTTGWGNEKCIIWAPQ